MTDVEVHIDLEGQVRPLRHWGQTPLPSLRSYLLGEKVPEGLFIDYPISRQYNYHI